VAFAPGPEAAPVLAVTASQGLPFGEGLRLAIDREGHVFVLDPGEKRVWRLGETGEPVPLVGPPSGWTDPADLSVSPDGRLHVLDAGGFIAVYHGGSRPARTLDLRPLGVYNPRGLAVGAREILLADTGGGRVLVLDREGRLERSIGRPGAGAGELSDPADVARDAAGGVVVVDAGNGRILRFRRDGHVEGWPRAGRRPGMTAERLDVASDGAVWVGGGGAPEVWRLAPGPGPRRHALAAALEPEGLAVGDRRLLLTAARPSRVLELALP
jgi:sugar lactone lactonase YvrE